MDEQTRVNTESTNVLNKLEARLAQLDEQAASPTSQTASSSGLGYHALTESNSKSNSIASVQFNTHQFDWGCFSAQAFVGESSRTPGLI